MVTAAVRAALVTISGEAVERVFRRGGTGSSPRSIDVPLRGPRGVVAKEFHEGVDADVGVR